MKTKEKRKPAVKTKPCPKCGSLDVVPILYGYPMPEAMDAADKGLIELGGCCVTGEDPRKHCNACGERFDFPRGPGQRRRTLG
jgi:hypothetical protein